MTRQGGLGRGLHALIPHAGPGESGLMTVRLSALDPNPHQPRTDFDDPALDELAHSIKDVGLLQPILVRPGKPGRYEIIAGERRFRAAQRAGLEEIPAVIRRTADTAMLTEALIENIHRSDLTPIEEALAYRQLLDDFEMTHDALGAKLGKSRSAITNALRLLGLPTGVQQQLVDGGLSAGHARALLGLAHGEQQERLAQRVVAEGLTVRATEDAVRRLTEGPDPSAVAGDLARRAASRTSTPYGHAQQRLGEALATRVRITGSAKRGRVVIDYAGPEDLERLLTVFSRGTGEDLLSG